MENKAQGAIEYLLIIGAAILVVAIVIIAITSVMNAGQDQGDSAELAQKKQSNTLNCQLDVNALGLQSGQTDCNAIEGSNDACNCCLPANTNIENLTSVCKD